MLHLTPSKVPPVSTHTQLSRAEHSASVSTTTNDENKSAGIATHSLNTGDQSATQSTLPQAEQSILNAHSTRRKQSEWDEPAYRPGERIAHHFSTTKALPPNQINTTVMGNLSLDQDLRKTVLARRVDADHTEIVRQGDTTQPGRFCLSTMDKTNIIPEQIRHNTGIVLAHLQPLQQLAEQEKCVLAIRHVDRLATQLIEAGYPTKNFHIKGKSASWGPQAGFICVDQGFSKLAGQDDQKIKKSTAAVRKCIEENHAAPVHLTLSENRLRTLVEKGIITLGKEQNGSITLSAKNPLGQNEIFFAKKQEDGDYLIYHENQPLAVLADKMHSLPLTADYDLLLLAPALEHLDNRDNLPVSDISHQTFLGRIAKYKSIPTQLQSHLKPDFFYQKEDPNLGHASARIRHMIPKINKALGCTPGKEVVHHNVDASSPAADPAANYPATFFTPFAIDGKKIHIVMNTDEMRDMIQTIKDAGYHTRLNPLWEKEVTQIKRPSFNKATEVLRNSKNSQAPN